MSNEKISLAPNTIDEILDLFGLLMLSSPTFVAVEFPT